MPRNNEVGLMRPYEYPSRMTALMGVAEFANGIGAYKLEQINVPDYKTRTSLESVDEILTGDATERTLAAIDDLVEALQANRDVLIEHRNEQITLRNEIAKALLGVYAKMREVIPQSIASFDALKSAEFELQIVKDRLEALCAMREKVITEAEDQDAGLTPLQIQDAHNQAADMLRQEGPVRAEVAEKKEWLALCEADFALISSRVKDIFDDEQHKFTAIRLLEQEAQIDAAEKERTAKRIGKAATLASRSTGRDWFGRKAKKITDRTAQLISDNAGPRVSVKNSNKVEEGN